MVTRKGAEARKRLTATFGLEERISFLANATFAHSVMTSDSDVGKCEKGSRGAGEWMSTRMRGGLIR